MLAASACETTTIIGKVGSAGDEDASTEGNTTDATGDVTPTSSASNSSADDGGTQSGSEGDDETTDAGSSSWSSGTTGPDACANLGEHQCIECAKLFCCPEVERCLEDEDCRCTVECLRKGGDPRYCDQTCSPGWEYENLKSCVEHRCPFCDGMFIVR